MRRTGSNAESAIMNDADGIAQTETDHFMKCPCCGEWFDMRDIDQSAA